jgi:hypothetical protein
VQRELDLAARRRGSFGDQLRLDPARLGESGDQQQREEDEDAVKHVSLCP